MIKKCKKALFATFTVLFILVSMELIFRLFYQKDSYIYYLSPSLSRDGYYFLSTDKINKVRKTTNVDFKNKDSKKTTFKIATFGASSTQGCPWSTELSFSHFLLGILKSMWPHEDFQVYNFGYFAQTYDFAVETIEDSIELKPDIIIVYSGNNELYYHNLSLLKIKSIQEKSLSFRLSNMFLENSIIFNLIIDWKTGTEKNKKIVIDESIRTNRERFIQNAIINYFDNTIKIARKAENENIFVLFCVPLRNMNNFSPLPDDELQSNFLIPDKILLPFDEKISPSNAYKLGKFYERNKEYMKAYYYYEKASDQTERVGRIHSEMIQILKSSKYYFNNCDVLDLEQQMLLSSNYNFIGDWALVDWCHPKVETNYQIAIEIVKKIGAKVQTKLKKSPDNPIPDFRQALREILPSKGLRDHFITNGYEEAGYLNVQFERWQQAIEYFEIALKDTILLKAALGLILSQLKQSNKSEVNRLSEIVLNTYDKNEIKKFIFQFYSPRDLTILLTQLGLNEKN